MQETLYVIKMSIQIFIIYIMACPVGYYMGLNKYDKNGYHIADMIFLSYVVSTGLAIFVITILLVARLIFKYLKVEMLMFILMCLFLKLEIYLMCVYTRTF